MVIPLLLLLRGCFKEAFASLKLIEQYCDKFTWADRTEWGDRQKTSLSPSDGMR
ncbi:MAG: hypothetical protein ACAF41_08920 [Leptolyngbya sp. BL-A-14]